MKKIISTSVILLLFHMAFAQSTSFYNLTTQTLEGKPFLFSSLKGKKVLIVNTASKCGYTPQYKDLEALYQAYKDKNFVIIGFPANNFGQQEPGTNQEIREFCSKNYGVSFPMMQKISVSGVVYVFFVSPTCDLKL